MRGSWGGGKKKKKKKRNTKLQNFTLLFFLFYRVHLILEAISMGDRQATLCFQDFIPTCYLLNEKYDAGSVSN